MEQQKILRINYKEKKLVNQEQINEEEIQSAVEEANLQWLADKSETNKQLKAKQREYEIAKTTFPLNCKKIINLKNDIQGLENGLKDLDILGEELGFKNLK